MFTKIMAHWVGGIDILRGTCTHLKSVAS